MTYLYNKNVNVLNANAIVSTTNPLPVTTLGGIYNSGGNLDTAKDAFGRARVAEPFTLFDSTFRYGDNSRIWDTALSGSGNTSYSEYESTINMTVSTASGDKVVRETKKVFKYQPGKSLLTLNSVVMNQPKENLRQRIGYFSSRDGHFLEANNTTLYIVERSGSAANVVDYAIPQSSWNVDKLDGTGPSGLSVNVANAQIFWTDTEWLGVGSVRAGFVIDGQFIISHIFHHANKTTSTYMTTATLPLRLEIENTGTTSSNSQLKHICNSIMSEGGFSPTIATRAISTSLAGKSISDTVYTPLVALRLKNTHLDSVVIPSLMSAYGLQNTPFRYRLSMDETITGGSWVSGGTESSIEYNITATSMSGGRVLLEGIFGGGTIGAPININLRDFDTSFQLRRKLNGTPETFVLSLIATSNNDDGIGTLTWEEF